MKKYLSLVKFSHTIFALPFAILGFILGVHTDPNFFDFKLFLLILACMLFARNAAMAFNRFIDRDIDASNPRTTDREIPAGIIKPKSALLFVVVNALLFTLCTYFINKICFYLSPIALLVILGYSFTKRISALCHFILGLGLSLAPIGAFLAVTGQFALAPILYGLAVLTWVSGFDIIYALQDEGFDKDMNLKSIPVALGRNKAMNLSSLLHLITGILLIFAGYTISLEHEELFWIHWSGTGIFLALLFYQHYIISPKDLSKVNLAFFTTNGIASIVFGLLVITDFYF